MIKKNDRLLENWFLGKIKNILVLLKETFFDIMQLSYTTDGSGINHREYNRVKESTVWANNSLDKWALFLVGRVKKLVSHIVL